MGQDGASEGRGADGAGGQRGGRGGEHGGRSEEGWGGRRTGDSLEEDERANWTERGKKLLTSTARRRLIAHRNERKQPAVLYPTQKKE